MGWIHAGSGGGHKYDDLLRKFYHKGLSDEQKWEQVSRLKDLTDNNLRMMEMIASSFKDDNMEEAIKTYSWYISLEYYIPAIGDNLKDLFKLTHEEVLQLCTPIIERYKAEMKEAEELHNASDNKARESLSSLSLDQLELLREMILWAEDNWCTYIEHPEFQSSGLPELDVNFYQVWDLIKERRKDE